MSSAETILSPETVTGAHGCSLQRMVMPHGKRPIPLMIQPVRSILSRFLIRRLPMRYTRHLGRFYSRAANLLKYGDPTFPASFHIETSEFCNRSCWYCSSATRPKRTGVISDAMFHLALARLQELNWTGPVAYHYENEPLLNPNLLSQIAQTCRALPRCIPTLVTNGDLLTHEQMDALVEAGVGRVIVSRHPPFRDAWDARIEAVRHAWPDRVSMMQVGVTLPVHKNGQFDHDGIAWQGHCIAPSLCLGIRMNGDVPLCGCDAKHLAVMGNIQTQSLNEIWRGREFCALRRTLRNGNLGHKICMGCSGMI